MVESAVNQFPTSTSSVRAEPLFPAGERRREGAVMKVADVATRTFLLGQLLTHLDSADPAKLNQFVDAGLTPELLDKLQGLTLADVVRCAQGNFGLAIHVDCNELARQLARLDRASEERVLYESFVRAGASPRLVTRLFGVNDTDVRRLRKAIAPEAARGGRPRLPDDTQRPAIEAVWRELSASDMSERERYWALNGRFPDLPIQALEYVVNGKL
jgi:hypothetical protein